MSRPDIEDLLDSLGVSGVLPPKVRATDPVIAGRRTVGMPPAAQPAGLVKLTVRIDQELAGRARAAYMADAARSGVTSLSEWIATAIEQAVDTVEDRVNGGAPFAPIGAGRVPKGRLFNGSPL